MHPSTFEYLKPTDDQIVIMATFRAEAAHFAQIIDQMIPDGPDKTYMMRKFREIAMWGNIAITRNPDGTPRA